jgi:hypothetical protein
MFSFRHHRNPQKKTFSYSIDISLNGERETCTHTPPPCLPTTPVFYMYIYVYIYIFAFAPPSSCSLSVMYIYIYMDIFFVAHPPSSWLGGKKIDALNRALGFPPPDFFHSQQPPQKICTGPYFISWYCLVFRKKTTTHARIYKDQCPIIHTYVRFAKENDRTHRVFFPSSSSSSAVVDHHHHHYYYGTF